MELLAKICEALDKLDETKPTDNLFNPDVKDFIFKCADEDNTPHEYTLRAQEITTLPKWIAGKGANDLANMLVWKWGIKTNYEDEKKAVLKEIYVEL